MLRDLYGGRRHFELTSYRLPWATVVRRPSNVTGIQQRAEEVKMKEEKTGYGPFRGKATVFGEGPTY